MKIMWLSAVMFPGVGAGLPEPVPPEPVPPPVPVSPEPEPPELPPVLPLEFDELLEPERKPAQPEMRTIRLIANRSWKNVRKMGRFDTTEIPLQLWKQQL